MRIKVQEAKWNNKVCYLGFIDFASIEKIINSQQDLAMNRKVNPERVDKITKYICDNIDKVFFPPVILNSCDKINVTEENSPYEIELKNNCLTIIDGQHRISAINKALKNKELAKKLKIKSLPFMLMEGLDDNEHRDLFNLINENSANVEATVSARFKISNENLYGLRYIRNNLKEYIDRGKNGCCVKDLIEWELKQSSEKICYIFITDTNKRFLKYFSTNFKDIFKEEENYNTIKLFWDKYFDFLYNAVENEVKAFYVKKVTLRSMIDCVLGEIEPYTNKATNYEDLKEKIDLVLLNLLTRSGINSYKGAYTQKTETYKEIVAFLNELGNSDTTDIEMSEGEVIE